MDPDWKEWSATSSNAYCPHCNALMVGLGADDVDFAQHLKIPYIVGFVGALGVSGLSMALDVAHIVVPALGAFGLWLAFTSGTKDHRAIGWLLLAMATAGFAGGLYVF